MAPDCTWCRPTRRCLRPGAFDLVLANLMALLLVDRAAEVQALLAPGGALVLSGLLLADVPPVPAAFAACGAAREHGSASGRRSSSSVAREPASLPRPEAAARALGSTLPDHVAHHAREVLRLRAGAEVHVFDGAGHEWHAVLDEVSRRIVSARMLQAVAARAESPLRLVLAMAALKGDRMELVLQKATELGVAEIWPVVTFRTDAAARPALEGSRAERWERVASGAAEQCGRATVPQYRADGDARGSGRARLGRSARGAARDRRSPALAVSPDRPRSPAAAPRRTRRRFRGRRSVGAA